MEREKEMKQEQEKLEKRIGLLNYLVDKDSMQLFTGNVSEGERLLEKNSHQIKVPRAFCSGLKRSPLKC